MRVNKSVYGNHILIIGLGNPLAGDDGLGCQVIENLQNDPLLMGVQVMVGGLDVLQLLRELQKAEFVILIDVVHTGGEPGTVYQIPLEHLPMNSRCWSEHQTSILEWYQSPFIRIELGLPPGVLLAVEVDHIKLFSEELTPTIAGKIPLISKQIRGLVEGKIYV